MIDFITLSAGSDLVKSSMTLEGKQPGFTPAMLASMVDLARDAIITKDMEGTVTSWSPGAERLFGYTAEEMIGCSITRIVPPELQEEETLILEALRCNRTLANFETARITKGGKTVPVSLTISPIHSASGVIIGALKLARDISDRKLASEELRTSEAHFTMVAQQSPVGIFEINPRGEFLFANEYWTAISGLSMAQAAGKGWLESIHPEDRERVAANWSAGIKAGAEFACLHRNCSADKIFWVVSTVKPIRDPAGDVTCYLGTVLDIIELERRLFAEASGKGGASFRTMTDMLVQRRGELESLVAEKTAELHEKTDELHHISYAMVHDMRAPLRALHGFAELLQEDAAGNASAQSQEYPRRIKIAVERFDMLVTDALNYTKVVEQGLPLAPMRIDRLINDLTQTYPNLMPDRADIRIEGTLPAVIGNESYLTQCFSNLLDNAVKFAAPGTRAKVRIWAEELADDSPINRRLVRVWVGDNGIGISKDVRHRLFGLFQKFNSSYEGTGVGLAIVRKVVERMGGRVGVESEEGKGSRFRVDLRRVD